MAAADCEIAGYLRRREIINAAAPKPASAKAPGSGTTVIEPVERPEPSRETAPRSEPMVLTASSRMSKVGPENVDSKLRSENH